MKEVGKWAFSSLRQMKLAISCLQKALIKCWGGQFQREAEIPALFIQLREIKYSKLSKSYPGYNWLLRFYIQYVYLISSDANTRLAAEPSRYGIEEVIYDQLPCNLFVLSSLNRQNKQKYVFLASRLSRSRQPCNNL